MRSKNPGLENPVTAFSEKTKEPKHFTTIQANTFYLRAELYKEQLAITLHDYISWKVFKESYSDKTPLTGSYLFSVFELDKEYAMTEKQAMIRYEFGSVLKRNRNSEFIIK